MIARLIFKIEVGNAFVGNVKVLLTFLVFNVVIVVHLTPTTTAYVPTILYCLLVYRLTVCEDFHLFLRY